LPTTSLAWTTLGAARSLRADLYRLPAAIAAAAGGRPVVRGAPGGCGGASVVSAAA
jgi:hypothetical protein